MVDDDHHHRPPTAARGSRRVTGPADPLDLLALDDELQDEEREVRQVVATFLAREIADQVPDWFERGVLPREVVPALGKLGLFGMHLEGYGCAGASAVMYGLACQELEAVDSGLRSLVSVQGSLAMFGIWRFGSEAQKEEWLPPMATGEVVGCFGLTEPDAGSDPSRMRTVARRRGDDWVLNGAKMWITNGTLADVAVVWAGTDEGVRGFVVPTRTPGFTATAITGKLSLRASVTAGLSFDDCVLPPSAVLPDARGLRGPLSCLDEARYGITWGATGAARTCARCALDYAGSRTQFDRPIAGFQLTQAKLVDMAVSVAQSSLLALYLGRRKDRVGLSAEQVSVGKRTNVAAAVEVARTARTILGANGIVGDYPVMRHMANLESVFTYEGTHEVHTLAIGRLLTGLSAFSG